MNTVKRTMTGCMTALCAMIMMLTLSLSVSAESKQAVIAKVEGGQDLVVMFNFDVEVVDIAFLSPSGDTYTAADTDKVKIASGRSWST